MSRSPPAIDIQHHYTPRVLEVFKAYERQSALVDALAKQLIDTAKLSQIIETSLGLAKVRENIASAAGLPPIGDADLRIASIALDRDLAVVTGNVRHFEKVPGLAVENWLE